ncbi:MAG: hypothetical protein WB779_02065 [Ignavibacteriaceae bacterium]
MLLETLDIKKNDIIIYSQNIFNLNNNFKIIFKDDEDKLPRKISFDYVCSFVDEFTPKNLIVYRLLTNIKDFKLDASKYGYVLSINNQTELIYYDPVFAVKELEKYGKLTNLNDLRFRIQQVGLTTLNSKRNLPNFAEIYAIDLEAMEAKFQNDKVFADAIVTFIHNKSSIANKEVKTSAKSISVGAQKSTAMKEVTSFAERIKQTQKVITTEREESIKEIQHEISEDKDFDHTQIMKLNVEDKNLLNETGMQKDVKATKGEDVSSPFGEFLRKKRPDQNEKKSSSEKKDFIDIFKSSASLKEYITSKENKKIVLRLDKK